MSGLWRGPPEGNIFQPQEFMLTIWLLLLKAQQINGDEKGFGKCVTTSHYVNTNLDQVVTGKVGTAILHQAIAFLDGKGRWIRQTIQPKGEG